MDASWCHEDHIIFKTHNSAVANEPHSYIALLLRAVFIFYYYVTCSFVRLSILIVIMFHSVYSV
jgi:hypothetical protein